jgi:hypothetical protein
MPYIRHDIDNNPVDPQPSYNEITLYDGTEGWSEITYSVWNGDYVARNVDNTTRTPGTYQARNADNTPRTPGSYQRHDENNDPILA